MTRPPKIHKPVSSARHFSILLYVPPEVLAIILFTAALGRSDLLSLSLVNRAHRALLLPHVFSRLAVPWERIPLFLQTYAAGGASENCVGVGAGGEACVFLTSQALQATAASLEISRPNSSLEWKLNKEVDVLINECLPSLQHLKINFTSGSFPLKYLKFYNKQSLKSFSVTTLRSGSVFSLDHLGQMQSIETLVLKNFKLESPSFETPTSRFISVNIGSEATSSKHCKEATSGQSGSTPKIQNLSIINCSWDYPTELSDFDRGKDCLRSIHLQYTNNNNFILSERFKSLLINPMASKGLQDFQLDLQDNEELIKHANIEAYLNFEALRGLEKVKLLGMPFAYNQ